MILQSWMRDTELRYPYFFVWGRGVTIPAFPDGKLEPLIVETEILYETELEVHGNLVIKCWPGSCI